MPATQLCPTEHAIPQPPQLAMSLMTFVHAPLQTGEPSLQVHMPWMQFCPAPQVMLQAPQLNGSLSGFVQPWLQLVSPTLHSAAHMPRSQTCVASQAVPQAPQFCALALVLMQLPAQFCRLPWQVQVATWQCCPVPHTLPQAPQLFESEAMLVQTPLQSRSAVLAHISPLVVLPLPVPLLVVPGVGSGELLEHAAAETRIRVADKVRNLSVDFIPNSLR